MTAAHQTVMATEHKLPVIDLSELDSPNQHSDFHTRLAKISRDHGFFYLVGHGITPGQINHLRRVANEFFTLSQEHKAAISIANTRHFRGYTGVGGELTRLRPDLREQIDFGEELPAVPLSSENALWWGLQGPNQWPDALPELRPAVLGWMESLRDVATRLLQAFLISLGQKPDALDSLIAAPRNNRMKIIHYPGQVSGHSDQGVGAHKDGGLLTLLLQDKVGGLQVQTPDGWVDATPLEGAFIVNIGEMLELATNGYLRASVHRVISPGSGVDRYSIAYFFSPSLHAKDVPLLQLPENLARDAQGPESDPLNPLFRHIGTNALKSRMRSHLDVAERFYPEQFQELKGRSEEAAKLALLDEQ